MDWWCTNWLGAYYCEDRREHLPQMRTWFWFITHITVASGSISWSRISFASWSTLSFPSTPQWQSFGQLAAGCLTILKMAVDDRCRPHSLVRFVVDTKLFIYWYQLYPGYMAVKNQIRWMLAGLCKSQGLLTETLKLYEMYVHTTAPLFFASSQLKK